MSVFAHRMIFIRHGETKYNAEGRLQGQRDIPLSVKGREQAAAVGRFLGAHMRAEIAALEAHEAFYASPLHRTRETIEIARAAMGLPSPRYNLVPRLKELTFGQWEGLTWGEVEAKYPGAAKVRETDKWNFVPPGGESYHMLVERVRPWVLGLSGDCFVASHGGVARALMMLLAGVDPKFAESANIWQGRALVFANGRFDWVG